MMTMRKEMDGVKSEMKDLKAIVRQVAISVAQIKGELTEFKEFVTANMATKQDISNLNARMDGFSGLLLDSRQRWAVHADTLKQHDERLNKLEKRPS